MKQLLIFTLLMLMAVGAYAQGGDPGVRPFVVRHANVKDSLRTTLLTVNGKLTLNDTLLTTGLRTSNPLVANGGITFQTNPSVTWTVGGAPVAVAGTDILDSAGVVHYSEIYIPRNTTLTGIGYLIGTTGGTDSVMVALYNSAGTRVAISTRVASTSLVGTASNMQNVPFSATYAAVAGQYFIGIQANGNTAKMRTYPIAGSKVIGAKISGGTYGTLPTITPAASMTVDVAPIGYVY